jgi:hypothetical protein
MKRSAFHRILLFVLAFGASGSLHAARALRGVAASEGLVVDGRKAAAGEAVPFGKTLSSGDAPADVRLPGVAAFRLAPRTVLRLLRDNAGGVRLALERGGVLSVVRKGSRYAVRTPVAAAAVRGTVFDVQVESPTKTYSCLCEGHYKLTTKETTRDVVSQGHTAYRVTDQAGEKAGLEHHTDEDIAALKALLK